MRGDLDVQSEHMYKLRTKPELCARHKGAHVQGDQAAALQAGGDVALDDALRQSFCQGGLAHSGLTCTQPLGSCEEELNENPKIVLSRSNAIPVHGIVQCRQLCHS